MQLPLLVVQYAGASGVVTLNNQIAGEISPNSTRISLPLPPQGSFYLGFSPFESEKMPFIVRLWADGEGLKMEQDMRLRVISWPGGVYSIEPVPLSIAKKEAASIPWVIARCSQGDLTATLYRENAYYLVIEDRKDDQLLFFYGLKYDPGESEMAFFQYQENLYLAVNGSQSAVLVHAKKNEVLFEEKYSAVRWDQGELAVFTKLHDTVGHEAKVVFDPESGNRKIQYGFFTVHPAWPQSKENTAKALMEAMNLYLHEEATGYLSKDLSEELDIETLRDFFKGHTRWAKPLFSPRKEVCLGGIDKNAYQAKLFIFEFVGEESEQGPFKIDNIKEE